MSQPTAEIRVEIDAEAGQYVATTPHVPELEARASEDHKAINGIIQKLREHRKRYEAKGEPVPWADGPFPAPGGDCMSVKLTGVCPASTVRPQQGREIETTPTEEG